MTAPFAFAEEKESTASRVLSSAGAKGGEIAVKLLASYLYDTSCPNRNLDKFTGYVCEVLGGIGGNTDAKWKQDITNQLKEINGKVDTISKGQAELQRSLAEMNADLNNKFKHIAQNVVAVQHLVRIEGLWEKYEAQFDKIDEDVKAPAMLAFAKEIMAEKPHTMLADLNTVLTKGIEATGGKPLIRYPLSEWQIAHTRGMGYEQNMMEAYDYAEKRFVDYRMREEKAYVMYLWAANVLETQCNLHPEQCTQPPRSTKDFKDDWNRYTQQQAAAFNSAVDWLLLSYSPYRITSTGNFIPGNKSMDVMLRANYVTSTMLGNGEGLWGRVISMGNAWDGSLQVTCGGAQQTLTPALKYTVPAGGSGVIIVGQDSGPVDWWVSSKGNNVYDEVRFSPEWQNYIYNFASAKAGPCSVSPNLPKGGVMPWVEPAISVVEVQPPKRKPSDPEPPKFNFGSFTAIQRAGGTYALVSGQWSGMTSPYRYENEGKGEVVTKDGDDQWFIKPNQAAGPQMGLYRKARGEWKFGTGSSRVHLRNKIALTDGKEVRFPEDSRVRINFYPGLCDGFFCNGLGSSSILAYDIENNDTKEKNGNLEAYVKIDFVDTSISDLNSGPGLRINGSYGDTGDHKTLNVTGPQSAVLEVNPQKSYVPQEVIYIDLWTQGRGSDASDFWYRALLAPAAMYLTK